MKRTKEQTLVAVQASTLGLGRRHVALTAVSVQCLPSVHYLLTDNLTLVCNLLTTQSSINATATGNTQLINNRTDYRKQVHSFSTWSEFELYVKLWRLVLDLILQTKSPCKVDIYHYIMLLRTSQWGDGTVCNLIRKHKMNKLYAQAERATRPDHRAGGPGTHTKTMPGCNYKYEASGAYRRPIIHATL